MNVNWKVIGIISLIVNVLFILLFSWGVSMAGDEVQCEMDICTVEYKADYWNYDIDTGICECYDVNYNELYYGVVN